MRDRQLLGFYAKQFKLSQRRSKNLLDLSEHQLIVVAADQSRFEVTDLSSNLSRINIGRFGGAQGVFGVVTRNLLQHQSTILHRPGQNTEVICGVSAGA